MKDRFDLNRLFQWDKKIHAGGLFGYLQKCRKMTVSQSRELADERFASLTIYWSNCLVLSNPKTRTAREP